MLLYCLVVDFERVFAQKVCEAGGRGVGVIGKKNKMSSMTGCRG